MKKPTININNAATLACVMAASRVFFGVNIDTTELYNSGWISILLGGIIAFPLFFCIQRHVSAVQAGNSIPNHPLIRVSSLIFGIAALLDSAITARCISNSASYAAFNHSIRFFLLVPLYIVVIWTVYCGGDAIGSNARIWIKLFPLYMLIIVACQITKYRITWLFPILGPGTNGLFRGAIKAAGWISTASAILIFSDKPGENCKRTNLYLVYGLIVLIPTALTLLRNMMAPVLISSDARTRMFELDLMLTNGRSPLLLQLPLIVMWFISLFNLLCGDVFIVCAAITKLLPRIKPIYCVLAAAFASVFLSMSVLSEQNMEVLFSDWQFVVNASAVAVIMLGSLLKGGMQECEN